MKKKLSSFVTITGMLLLVANIAVGQTLRKIVKQNQAVVGAPTHSPEITAFSPGTASTGQKVTIIGHYLQDVTEVKFNGVPAASVQKVSAECIIAEVGAGGSGALFVLSPRGFASIPGFVFFAGLVPAHAPGLPTISSIIPAIAGSGAKVTIVGTDFTGATAVALGGTFVKSFTVISPTTIIAVVNNGATGDVTVTTPLGTATFAGFNFSNEIEAPGTESATAGADFTIPDVGQNGLNIILTPTFIYNKIYSSKKFGITGTFWGNSFGVDSTKQKAGTKFLIPESSMIGLKIDGAYYFSGISTDDIKIGPVGEINLLWKKVSYLDTASKISTNFTPFVIHSKIGLSLLLWNANVSLSGYMNFLAIGSENDAFSNFFNTGKKSLLIYPEVNGSMVFDVGEKSNQTIKIGVDMIINNSNAKYLSGSTDKLIPYLKIGIASKL
ncbi:IPT/TIG domain-containing protein [Mucilaginibacter angelicae]|uniref:IPT/TIG domain-containing protein n=1 Tax=Mucilaginibacter angelicae TaxID=869718 RepID=A0ABV6L1Z0_9SPHI